MKLLKSYYKTGEKLRFLTDYPPLLIRFILAYGFYNPAKMKWSAIEDVAGWFESMNYPLPLFNAYLSATTEALGIFLLIHGFTT